MSEKPIPFSGPMVRAILNGQKTMSRRLVKHPENMSISGIAISAHLTKEWE